jgi:hypothetical protein
MIGCRRQDIGADPARLIQPFGLGSGLRASQCLLDRLPACQFRGGGLIGGNWASLCQGWGLCASRLLDRCVSTHIRINAP